jgi:hypothetical protein
MKRLRNVLTSMIDIGPASAHLRDGARASNGFLAAEVGRSRDWLSIPVRQASSKLTLPVPDGRGVRA